MAQQRMPRAGLAPLAPANWNPDAQANGGSTEPAQDCKATYARFKKIKTGYSMGHVRTFMGGCDGELMSSSSIGSDRYNTYVWRGDGISLMQITFRDRTAVTINQFGLQ